MDKTIKRNAFSRAFCHAINQPVKSDRKNKKINDYSSNKLKIIIIEEKSLNQRWEMCKCGFLVLVCSFFIVFDFLHKYNTNLV